VKQGIMQALQHRLRDSDFMRKVQNACRSGSQLTEQLRFLGRMVANPRRVGAIAPSGPALAQAMVAQVDMSQPGPVLELGPGSGVMTHELLARGLPPGQLTLIERDPEFAKVVAQRFPGVNVINGDAFKLNEILAGKFAQPFKAIISGIPLLNLPEDRRGDLIDVALDQLAPGAPFIQFSYGFHSPVAAPFGATVEMTTFIWRNLPPARVWVYRRDVQSSLMRASA
jgi:phosphatidylethanolamine/phosphatidyl-N-methylethanolamine N-methyltransferase